MEAQNVLTLPIDRWGLTCISVAVSEKRSCCEPDQRSHWSLHGNVYNGRDGRCRKPRQSSKMPRRYLLTQRQQLSKSYSWDNTVAWTGFGMDGDQWADLQRQDWSVRDMSDDHTKFAMALFLLSTVISGAWRLLSCKLWCYSFFLGSSEWRKRIG